MSTASIALDANEVRQHFPYFTDISSALSPIYLDNAATSQRVQEAIGAVVSSMTHRNSNVHRGTYDLAVAATEQFEADRQTIASFVGAQANEIVFTKNATEALNLLAHCLREADAPYGLRQDDTIVVTEMEHHSNIVPWRQAARATGCHVRYMRPAADGRVDISTLHDAITTRTKIVALAHVSHLLGTLTDLAPIVERAHQVGAMVVVDAAQSAPHLPIDVTDLAADFLVFTGHKMCGPTGIGVLWGRTELLHALPPFLGGGNTLDDLSLTDMTFAAPPQRFEAGTPPIAEVAGLAAAATFLSSLGMERIRRHDRTLTAHALQRLRADRRVAVLGPYDPEQRGAVISFVMEGHDPMHLAQRLSAAGIAVRAGNMCAQLAHDRLNLRSSIRLSTYLYNTTDDIDALIDALPSPRMVLT
ncbi:aminotransferase class V-fold PLP-dependent enzyme [Streptomyces zagrosensis]|uniref:cysteine desulfurase n=1 Tax=Streptomyces zagrosensis TaxID=1042984 RepID=A0A7W9QG20_9ACTN|nr:aminotransferase class V-fold PLP-dependent enzyme [Streptomyces zagrosensis]MBB5938562.1 cysteine desulfurase/selenocysteine lyase [Streptomyces zagrosensis]